MPLALLGTGLRRTIKSVHGDAAVRKHLTELGFVEGAEVEVIAENGGSLIVGLYGSRLAINADIAQKIFV